jgi:hypothetical protein
VSDGGVGDEMNVEFEYKLAWTLHVEETAIKDLDYEAGVVISRDGDVILRMTGKEHEVDAEAGITKGRVFTHNHPGGICAFSGSDLFKFALDESYELRAVTRDGRFVSLKENSDIPRRISLAEAFEKAGLSTNRELYLKADLQAMKKYGRKRTLRQAEIEGEKLVNEWLREYADKYGIKFLEGLL